MSPEQREQLQLHLSEVAKLLYADADANDMPMDTLAEIEMTVRSQLLNHVSPTLGNFLSKAVQAKTQDITEP